MAARDRPQASQIRVFQPSGRDTEPRVEEFKADPDSLNMLLEMGYARNDALIALKITSNNLEQACTFLLNNPNPATSLGYQVHIANQESSSGQAAADQASRARAGEGQEQQRLGQYAT